MVDSIMDSTASFRATSITGAPGRMGFSASAPLVDEATFVAVQRIRAGRRTKDGDTRKYALAGLVVFGMCGRRMDSHWVHGHPG
jgi:hypothetical protein